MNATKLKDINSQINDYLNTEDDYVKRMDLIDSGSYSKVYLFVHDNFKYIVKRCNKYLLSTHEINYIYKEIYLLKSLNHRNIVKIKSYNEVDNFIDIIMYYSGKSLESIKKNLSKKEIKIIIKNVLEGLQYLHNKNIIHCDLSPSNILVKDINLGKVYICDFGLSVDHNHEYILPIGNMIGNNKFMAPEILMMDKLSNKSDLWSVGIIVYYLLTNNYPFRCINESNIVEKLNKFNNSQFNKNKLTSEEFDFIKNLLVLEPTKRMSINDALNHPWLNLD